MMTDRVFTAATAPHAPRTDRPARETPPKATRPAAWPATWPIGVSLTLAPEAIARPVSCAKDAAPQRAKRR